jgi:ABC-type sugar transport system ATPase subunit
MGWLTRLDLIMPPIVELSGIGKRFSGLPVLSDVNLHVLPGFVHAIVGENGAGKSTLGKIIGGVYRPDEGEIRVDGELVRLRTPASALGLGVTVMKQEIALAPHLSVIENVLLGREPSRFGFANRRAARHEFAALLGETGFDLPADVAAADLPLAEQQQVEILRALARKARVIVMDEPTAALPAVAAARLRQIIRDLKSKGVAIIYISHFLEETLELSDSVTVLRNGRVVESKRADQWTVGRMIEAMLGRSLVSSYPKLRNPPPSAPLRLEVRDLVDGNRIRGMTLSLRAGEIVGLFGLVGSGRSELAHAIFGAERFSSGQIQLDGQGYSPIGPADALAKSVALLPESRKDQGLFLDHTKRRNTVASGLARCAKFGFIDRKQEGKSARRVLRSCDVEAANLSDVVGLLSGGNQQKVLLGKTLYLDPRVLILDEPTRGVDVGARRSIYDTIARLVSDGMSVILISSDIEEVHQMSHRLYVVREGQTVAEFKSSDATHSEILAAAFGYVPGRTQPAI